MESTHAVINDRLGIIVRKITLRYERTVFLDEIEVKSDHAKHLVDALNLVFEELILPIVNEKIKTAINCS